MARFAKINISCPLAAPAGEWFELELFGATVRFTSGNINESGTNRGFTQDYTNTYGYVDAAGNSDRIAKSVQRYLASIGETDYTVNSYWTANFMGYPATCGIIITANRYDDDLNFSFFASSRPSTQNYDSFSPQYTTNDNPPAVHETIINATCFGSTTGSVLLEVTGGLAPYTFAWSDGSTTKDRTDLPAGTYTVTVTDSTAANGADHPGVTVLAITIGQNSQIQATAITGNNSIVLQVSGGIAPYSFLWHDGVTTKDRSNVTEGTYSVRITDSVGCNRSFSFVINRERFYYSQNPITLELTALEPETKPNLTFLCEVWVEPVYLSGNFIKVTVDPLEHPADSQGKTVFNVRRLLDAFVEPHLPAVNQNTVFRADKAFKRFYLKHTEKYGEPPVPETFTQVDNRVVVCGGLDAPEHYSQAFFSSYMPNQKPFLSWDLRAKEVFTDQPEFLYFMPYRSTTSAIKVKVDVRFADQSTGSYEVFSVPVVNRYEIYCIPAGFEQLQLVNKKPGVAVLSWYVYVLDGQNRPISETRHFKPVLRYFRQKRYLVYANSLGGVNTLVATGASKRILDPEAQLLEKSLLPTQNPENGDVSVIDIYAKPSLELSTGYRSKAEVIALQDFLLSKQIKLIDQGRYIPATLLNKNTTIDDEQEDYSFIDFTLELPKMYHYSPALPVVGINPEPIVTQTIPDLPPES